MIPRRRDEPMDVKYWSFAGLMLTYWCNARCASCYLRCGQDRHERMSVDMAMRLWRELIDASPHGCRVHLSGGEAFGDWERLIELCSRARDEKLSPPAKIETNAFWASGAGVVRRHLRELDAAGMRKIVISADPYHQRFVPIERCRLLAREATEILGPQRVQVRWRDWLAEGFDTDSLDCGQREALFTRWAASGRDRMNGRAAETLAPRLPGKPAEQFRADPCREALLRSRHVHVGPDGLVMPGTCAGIALGRALDENISSIWRRLEGDFDDRAVVGTLAREGPEGLLGEAVSAGYVARRAGYANKCHLCWLLRKFFVSKGRYIDQIGPRWLYV